MSLLFGFLILGFIQGITEPIPVSSSGHLLVVKELLGNLDIDYSILATLTNTGSLIAIVLLFFPEIKKLWLSFFGYLKTKENKYYADYKYCWLVVLATIPAGIMGLVVTKLNVFDFLEENVKMVGITLLITALFLFLIRNFKGKKEAKDITFKDALMIGFYQVIALIPGISRSGATIVGGMFQGLKREVAFTFSFILYIPISIATLILGIKDFINADLSFYQGTLYFISAFVAFLFTYFATKWFRNVVKEGKLIYFVYYCLLIGTLIILFL